MIIRMCLNNKKMTSVPVLKTKQKQQTNNKKHLNNVMCGCQLSFSMDGDLITNDKLQLSDVLFLVHQWRAFYISLIKTTTEYIQYS